MMNTQDPHGDQRVAAFLLSLERDQAAEIMSRLDPAAVPVVAKAMLELDESFSDPESVDSLYAEVARDLHTRYGVDCAPVDSLNELLDKSFGPERGAEVAHEIESRRLAERPFAMVEDSSPASIAVALSEETASLVTGIRKPFTNDIKQLRRFADNVNRNKGELDRALQVLPIKLEKLGRTAIYGSYFNFYLCHFQGRVRLPGGSSVPVDYNVGGARCDLG